jgi:hypothetical protein
MPEKIQLFRVFVGAPSDVDEALDVIRGQIEQWNRDHGPLARTRLEFTNWHTHSHPAAGDRPQSLINKQVVDKCDILVGVFQSRFGTPTGIAASGTEEEIRRCIKGGKTVMVYFAQLLSASSARIAMSLQESRNLKGNSEHVLSIIRTRI